MDPLDRVARARPAVAGADADVVERARGRLQAELARSGRARRLPARRTLLLVGVGAVVWGAVGVGVAGVVTGWWDGRAPGPVSALPAPPPRVDQTQSVVIPPVPGDLGVVARAGDAELLAGPSSTGGFCLTIRIPGGPSMPTPPCMGQDGAAVTFAANWAARDGDRLRWFVYGRTPGSDARSVTLFGGITQPSLRVRSGLGRTAVTVSVGESGYFLAEIPGRLWSTLHGARGTLEVRDGDGRVLESDCRLRGVAPFGLSTTAAPTVGRVAEPASCPATGSLVDEGRMVVQPIGNGPRARIVRTGATDPVTARLTRPGARAILVAAWFGTAGSLQLLELLEHIARAHPDVRVIAVVQSAEPGYLDALADLKRRLGLSFPITAGQLDWTPRTRAALTAIGAALRGGGPAILVLDGQRRLRAVVGLADPGGSAVPFQPVPTVGQLEQALASGGPP